MPAAFTAGSATGSDTSTCDNANGSPVATITTWLISTGRQVKDRKPWKLRRKGCGKAKAPWMIYASSLPNGETDRLQGAECLKQVGEADAFLLQTQGLGKAVKAEIFVESLFIGAQS